MTKKMTPFWREAMAEAERTQRIIDLFTLLNGTTDDDPNEARTFVFVPDPPPLGFDMQAQGTMIRRIFWGHQGRAAVTGSSQAATMLAPVMFDLWPDTLYVFALEVSIPDDEILSRWILSVVSNETDVSLPCYSLVVFDWGDLVENVPVKF